MQPDVASAPLIGRDAELAVATRLLAAASSGAGGVLVVVGEAGIGKSRLLNEVASIARAGGSTVLTGRAVPGGGTYSAFSWAIAGLLRALPPGQIDELRPFRAAISRLAPGWVAADPPGSTSPEQLAGPDPTVLLGEGLLQLLIGAANNTDHAATCLLVLEDLQWADPDTLALVGYLTGAVQSTAVIVAMSARDDQAATSAQSSGAISIDDIRALPGVTIVRLDRLPAGAVAAIATGGAGAEPIPEQMMSELIVRADGLPIVIDELLNALREADGRPEKFSVPPTLSALVRRRFGGLTDTQRVVVQAAAVLGVDPDWRLLGAITGQSQTSVLGGLKSAVEAGLLVSEPGRLRWRHALTRDAVLGTMLAPELAAMALLAAQAVAAEHDPRRDALEAELLELAGERGRSGAVLLRLARRDMARAALRSAADHIDRAAAAGVDEAALTLARVQLLTLSGREGEALRIGEANVDRVTGDDHAELCLRLARAAVSSGRWALARRYVARAGRPADPRSTILLAEAAFGEGDPRRAAELAGVAVNLAQRDDHQEALCAALLVVGRCAELDDLAGAAAAFGRAAQVAAEHGLPPWRIEAMFGLGRTELSQTADPALLHEVHELAVDAGLLTHALSIEVILGEHALLVDGPAAAATIARGTADRAGRLGLTGLQAMSQLFIAAGRGDAGDLAGMRSELETAMARPDIPPEVRTVESAVRGIPVLVDHDLKRADELLDQGMASLVTHASAAPMAYWGLWAVLRVAVANDRHAVEFLRSSAPGLRVANRGAIAYADAIAAGRSGEGERAVERFAAGDRMLARGHWWRRLLRLVVLEAAVVDRWGDPVPELRADLAVFERDGEDRLARTCRDLLRQAGSPTRRGRGNSAVPPNLRALGVTVREVDVLELISAGLPNAEIARRLFLSPRTVETHVANLLVKTGAADRVGLRELARQPAGDSPPR